MGLDLELSLEGIIIRVNVAILIAALVILCLIPMSIAAEDISSLVKQVMPGVVLIKTYDSNGNNLSQGSGFVASEDGDIITCYHVLRGYSTATVTTADEKEFQVWNVIALNKSDDLARISLSAANYNFTNLSMNTTTPDVGQEVIAIGGPLGLEKTVSQGIVSAIRNNTIQITAPISPGSSGGPVFNMIGEVIGIVSSQMKSGQNLNFAIPSNLISTMQIASAERINELREPYYPEVESPDADAPLWRIWGYTSEEEFLREKVQGRPGSVSGGYNKECTLRYLDKEKFEDAIICYDCILKTNPSYSPSWNNKGVALYYLTRYEEALGCFNKSIEIDSIFKTYWQNKGAILWKIHRKAEAEVFFAKIASGELKSHHESNGIARLLPDPRPSAIRGPVALGDSFTISGDYR
jgi:hypothetical protein